MLVSLRLFLTDGRERQVAAQVADVEPPPPWELLERMSKGGRVRLGDREECELGEVERVELVPPAEPRRAPEWTERGRPRGARLRDEDVSAALRERRDDERPAP